MKAEGLLGMKGWEGSPATLFRYFWDRTPAPARIKCEIPVAQGLYPGENVSES